MWAWPPLPFCPTSPQRATGARARSRERTARHPGTRGGWWRVGRAASPRRLDQASIPSVHATSATVRPGSGGARSSTAAASHSRWSCAGPRPGPAGRMRPLSQSPNCGSASVRVAHGAHDLRHRRDPLLGRRVQWVTGGAGGVGGDQEHLEDQTVIGQRGLEAYAVIQDLAGGLTSQSASGVEHAIAAWPKSPRRQWPSTSSPSTSAV